MSKYDKIGNSGLPWQGYYITGYGLAVKRGFEGTEEEWLASLKGETGATGAAIVSQTKTGEDESGGYIYTQTFDDGSTKTFTAPKGAKGDTGEDGADGEDGVGVPSGGTTGQVLKKKSGTNYDTAWSSVSDLESDPVFTASAAYGISAGDISNWNGKYSLPGNGIPSDVMTASVQTSLGKADTAYQKPASGIPKSDLASSVQVSINKADSALQSVPNTYRTAADQDVIDAGKYEKPASGIPSSDMTSAVQTSLGLADTAYQKPASGIPESDLAQPVKTKLNRHDVYFATYDETDGFNIIEALTAQKSVFVLVPAQDNSIDILPLTYHSGLPATGQFSATFTKAENNVVGAVQMEYDVTQSPTTSWSTEITTLGTYSKPSGGIPETDLESAVKNKIPFVVNYNGPSSPAADQFTAACTALQNGRPVLMYLWDNSRLRAVVPLSHMDYLTTEDYRITGFYFYRVWSPSNGTCVQEEYDLHATFWHVGQKGIDANSKEISSNKVTALSASSTDTQYPSAKCVYDLVGNIESLLSALR